MGWGEKGTAAEETSGKGDERKESIRDVRQG